MTRLEKIRAIVDKAPNDPFARYGLAMELKNVGHNEEARTVFGELAARHPDYVPLYLMYGNLLTSMGLRDDARKIYESGIEAARQKRDMHALSELQSALDQLADAD